MGLLPGSSVLVQPREAEVATEKLVVGISADELKINDRNELRQTVEWKQNARDIP